MSSKIVLTVAALVLMPAVASDGRAVTIPFGIETYTPFTKASFELPSNQDCSLMKSGAIADLLENSRSIDSAFDEQRVRGILEEENVSIYVDARGVFKYADKAYVVTEENFKLILKRHFLCKVPLASKPRLVDGRDQK
jgi:hypothetical protein